MKNTLPSLGDVVMVSIDVDSSEDADQLRRFSDQQGFTWRFAIASRDALRQLATAFGTQFMDAPSEPMFIIDPKGTPHLVPFEHRDAARLAALVRQYRGS